MKLHSTEYAGRIVRRDHYAFTRCGRVVATVNVVFGKDTRRVTCRTCRSTKKARTP